MIRSVERALSIFEAFTPERSSMSLVEIGKQTKLSKATTYRLVSCLDKAGYLVRMENQQYCLSLKLVGLAGIVRSTLSIRDLARTVMSELVKMTGETITLNTVSGDTRLCIEVFDTPAPLMTIVKRGEQAPLTLGATGKILLAYLDKKRIDELSKGMPAGERAGLARQLEKFRQQGYALTRSERVTGVTAISVPVHDAEKQCHYSLSVTGPSVRIDPNEERLVNAMLAAGRKLSKQLGASAVSDVSIASEPPPAKRQTSIRKAKIPTKKLAEA